MGTYPGDIYAEPADVSTDTLAHLGPLAPMAATSPSLRDREDRAPAAFVPPPPSQSIHA